MTQENVLIAFGSNLGDRKESIQKVWNIISEQKSVISAVAISDFYETEPVGGRVDQPRYLNAAATIQTALEPIELLYFFQDIEQQLGRVRRERWGARTIDIDILLYGKEIVGVPDLVIPHPEMLRRRFVLEPAKDVAPDWVVPTTCLTIIQHFLQIK